MRVLGIDCDTNKLAVVALDDGKYAGHWLIPDPKTQRKKEIDQRLLAIWESWSAWLADNPKPDWVYIEDVPYVNSAKVMTRLAFVVGAALLDCLCEGIPTTLIGVSTWKKLSTGRGDSSKEQVKAWARVAMPELADDLMVDLYDAAAIAHAGAFNFLGRTNEISSTD